MHRQTHETSIKSALEFLMTWIGSNDLLSSISSMLGLSWGTKKKDKMMMFMSCHMQVVFTLDEVESLHVNSYCGPPSIKSWFTLEMDFQQSTTFGSLTANCQLEQWAGSASETFYLPLPPCIAEHKGEKWRPPLNPSLDSSLTSSWHFSSFGVRPEEGSKNGKVARVYFLGCDANQLEDYNFFPHRARLHASSTGYWAKFQISCQKWLLSFARTFRDCLGFNWRLCQYLAAGVWHFGFQWLFYC